MTVIPVNIVLGSFSGLTPVLKYFEGILTAREANQKLDIEYSDTSDSEDDKREEIISDLINER